MSIHILQQAIQSVTGMTDQQFLLSETHWQTRTYKKSEFYNEFGNVCKYLGFVLDGVFRTYFVDEKTGEEKNLFLYSQHQFVVSFQSFINQAPCHYHTQAITDATILYIHVTELRELYRTSHEWEHFGRMVAEIAFNISMERTRGFLNMTPEDRYLQMMSDHPDLFNQIPLYHISSYLGIQVPSLSRIRKRLSDR